MGSSRLWGRAASASDSRWTDAAARESPREAAMKIRMSVDGQTITASLDDNATARDRAHQGLIALREERSGPSVDGPLAARSNGLIPPHRGRTHHDSKGLQRQPDHTALPFAASGGPGEGIPGRDDRMERHLHDPWIRARVLGRLRCVPASGCVPGYLLPGGALPGVPSVGRHAIRRILRNVRRLRRGSAVGPVAWPAGCLFRSVPSRSRRPRLEPWASGERLERIAALRPASTMSFHSAVRSPP
jgi:hypothetical protein